MPDDPDFRLDGYKAAGDQIEDAFIHYIGVFDFTGLAEHHTPDGHSYYVLHGGPAIVVLPGEPQLVALHIQRDSEAGVYRFEHARLPLAAMAQNWLIARGCPREGIRIPPGAGAVPADARTRALEEQLVDDRDFAFLASYTHDSSTTQETTVLLRAVDETEPLPFRVLLERVDTTARSRTLREGAFRAFGHATSWWETHWRGHSPELPFVSRRAPGRRALPAGPVSADPWSPGRAR
ncbi:MULTISPECIES: hypothetical protein [Streptomyces]|uniref:Uncharacterized protein n=1 Tax=Streptomyces tsukubensis (strain DSM 42081 / NBRC 108919 / NRRL 18488 / 9993) TaxID=1114943 RepID=I2N7V3_STRT9|nr:MULTISPECIES: hypothetical protein [Streptomyces]AZK97060.1 hypothetical protein B7R87_26710 [Streptomyces tsukubensis]EIF93100.1 hypothetical protein [Streptomyces tsukubensis NRRL18488]MYS66497.1 hypothetical protein [Streptomyces sp. SID5473]QKM66968.1 hypothetical protein STSU_007070 [Streptomyces tsukubensis NRRL18488]TAI41555.1 hypothetical protein EWI31_27380 [Streptomyces tsukubensis]